MGEVRQLFLVLLAFSGIIIGMSGFYGSITSANALQSYGYTAAQINAINPDDLSSLQSINAINQKVKDIEETLNSQPTGIGIVDVAWGYLNAGFSALTIPLDATFLFGNTIDEVVNVLGLPAWVIGVVFGALVMVLLFIFISSRLKWPV